MLGAEPRCHGGAAVRSVPRLGGPSAGSADLQAAAWLWRGGRGAQGKQGRETTDVSTKSRGKDKAGRMEAREGGSASEPAREPNSCCNIRFYESIQVYPFLNSHV